LFAERGYKAVTLRDIAQELGIRQASLYYHFPGGKEELYVTVTERGLRAHAEGLRQAIRDSGPDLEAQLRAVLEWLVSHPPVDLARMLLADFPAVSPEHAKRLTQLTLESLVLPIESMIVAAKGRHEARVASEGLAAALVLTAAEGVIATSRLADRQPADLVEEAVATLLSGFRRC
jgi:AcrR family transcriptional regulator